MTQDGGHTGLTQLACAKINLSLHIAGRRDDGYHELDGLVAFAEVGDVLRVEPSAELTLAIEGPFARDLEGEPKNLVLRAARVLAGHAAMDPRARIALDKQLPVAAGLGGGSADAAATLRALQALWRVDLPADVLEGLALELGADVPVCLRGHAAYISGIGERIEAAPPLPETWLVLVNPGVALSTAEVFRTWEGDFSAPVQRWTTAPGNAAELAYRLSGDGNDLEAPARALAPVIDEAQAALLESDGCLLARMSGSGATSFGLFADLGAAEAAAADIAAVHRDWWVRAARLVS